MNWETAFRDWLEQARTAPSERERFEAEFKFLQLARYLDEQEATGWEGMSEIRKAMLPKSAAA